MQGANLPIRSLSAQLRSQLPVTKVHQPGLVLTSLHLQIQPWLSHNLSLSLLEYWTSWWHGWRDEVTRHLSPPEVPNVNSVSDTSRPNALSEVLLVSAPPPATPPAAALQVPGSVAATQGMTGTILQRSLGTTQTSLSGEVQVPRQLFTSLSLPIDARVSEKLHAKIWNEFFYFSHCLTQFLRIDINKLKFHRCAWSLLHRLRST